MKDTNIRVSKTTHKKLKKLSTLHRQTLDVIIDRAADLMEKQYNF